MDEKRRQEIAELEEQEQRGLIDETNGYRLQKGSFYKCSVCRNLFNDQKSFAGHRKYLSAKSYCMNAIELKAAGYTADTYEAVLPDCSKQTEYVARLKHVAVAGVLDNLKATG